MVNTIFALDIGTRTVVGVLARGSADRDLLEIIDMEVMEHSDRSMFDGQIHDIPKVTEVVRQVKTSLETRNNCRLQHVSVAAAGRALITHRVRVAESVEGREPADTTFINSLELKAVQEAQQQIQDTYKDNSQHYCVGYSVVDYYLDGVPIKSLEGHRGHEMGVEVIATFLPRSVVESLYAVMERSGLEVINLTLEPIAAITLAIPEKLRMLNLAMVDIGAGTSDIAISRNGSISAYAMVSMAGDEVTDEIAQHFLLDFQSAEGVKRKLFSGASSTVCRDVMGNQLTISREELCEIVRPVVERISHSIAESIIEYNQGPPKALFCIGGGSLTPGIKECLQSRLGLPESRVGIKGLEDNERLMVSVPGFTGPDYITPVGIALAGYRGGIPREIRDKMGVSLYGCDRCIEACPHNRHGLEDSGPAAVDLERLVTMDKKEFDRLYKNSALGWRGLNVIKRNAVVALGNLGARSGLDVLEEALKHPSAVIRGHAAWAVGRIGGQRAREMLEKSLDSERDQYVREEITAALAGLKQD
jgi:cell division protein FtsA